MRGLVPPVSRRVFVAMSVILSVLGGVGVRQALADPGDIGIPGPGTGTLSFPTAEKPESKLWFHDGFWWGSLWSVTSQAHRVHRFNPITDQWEDVGPVIDTRRDWRQDTLSAGAKLYIASHRFTTSVPAAGSRADLYRFSYNAGSRSYSLDTGFPAQINNMRTETLVIDRDSTGRLWATWTAGDSVWVNSTVCSGSVCNDGLWGTPFDLASIPAIGTAAALVSDDISAVTAFGGNRIGVMWSSQSSQSFRFAIHQDGSPTNSWTLETVAQSADIADDHINFATTGSTVFAAVKTSIDTTGKPSTLLLKRVDGAGWTSFTTSDGADRLTRPIVVVDESAQRLHYFLGENTSGKIWRKTSPIAAPSFAPGQGEAVIFDASANDANNPTSTKQAVSAATGLRVLASDRTSQLYWTHKDLLNGSETLVAGFGATPQQGVAPLSVSFSDLSSGNPSSWSWSFGDSTTSTEQNPTHVYSQPGSYTVSLTASNGSSADEEVKTNYITVTAAQSLDANFTSDRTTGGAPLTVSFADTSTGSPSSWAWDFGDGSTSTSQSPTHTYLTPGVYTVSLTATAGAQSNVETKTNFVTVTVQNTYVSDADAPIKAQSPTNNYGNDVSLRVRAPSPEHRSVVQFNVTNESPGPHSAKLRLYSTDGGPTAGDVYLAGSTIDESTLTWANQPSFGSQVAAGGPVGNGSWAEWDVSSTINGNGVYTFVLVSTSTNSVYFSSSEGPNPPQLVVSPLSTAEVANFEGAPTTGTAPLTVTFTDQSTGASSWAWDFGDGTSSTLQNPSHTYAASATPYTVTLAINGGGGTKTLTRSNYVTVQPPIGLSAAFSATPTSGSAPLVVQFTDSSLGGPTSWTWDFGDGQGSTAQSPSHTFAAPGAYSVRLDVSNGVETATVTRTGYIVVSSPPTVFQASADAQVNSGSAARNYGTTTEMRVRAASPEYRSYVAFSVPAGKTSMRLRLFAPDGGPNAGDVYAVPAGSWTESGLTWANQPSLPSTPIALGAAVADGAWFEWDVSSALAPGVTSYSFVVVGRNTNSVFYNTREAATNKPEVVVA